MIIPSLISLHQDSGLLHKRRQRMSRKWLSSRNSANEQGAVLRRYKRHNRLADVRLRLIGGTISSCAMGSQEASTMLAWAAYGIYMDLQRDDLYTV